MLSMYISAAASGWAGWALAHPEFGSSVNPITTRGADYAHHITASPPGFEIPAASLKEETTCKNLKKKPDETKALHQCEICSKIFSEKKS